MPTRTHHNCVPLPNKQQHSRKGATAVHNARAHEASTIEALPCKYNSAASRFPHCRLNTSTSCSTHTEPVLHEAGGSHTTESFQGSAGCTSVLHKVHVCDVYIMRAGCHAPPLHTQGGSMSCHDPQYHHWPTGLGNRPRNMLYATNHKTHS
jgi:hypothetical protein